MSKLIKNRMDKVWRVLWMTCLVLAWVTTHNGKTNEKNRIGKVWRVLRVTCLVLVWVTKHNEKNEKNKMDKVWRFLRVTCLVLAWVTKRIEYNIWTKQNWQSVKGFTGGMSCLSMRHKTYWKKQMKRNEWTKFEGFYGWHVLS